MNLGVAYDLACQPHSVGDVLMLQQASLVLRLEIGAEKVDFVLTHDPARQLVPKWMPAVARVNQHLGETGVYSHVELKATGREWWAFGKTHYLFYDCMEMLRKCYESGATIPALRPLPDDARWARSYLDQHGTVTIQFRRNVHHPRRNSNYGQWRKFIERHPRERFVAVCAPHEADQSIRLPNVKVVCDDPSVDAARICALVEASDLHLGVASGPAMMRLCSARPYVLFRDTISAKRVPALRAHGERLRYVWGTEHQTHLPVDETVERIDAEFARMREGVVA